MAASIVGVGVPSPVKSQQFVKKNFSSGEQLRFPSKVSHHRKCLIVTRASDGSPALFAKEMERVSAKEALLLSIKDAGGLQYGSANQNDAKVIDVFEKLLTLERLNPTPRPTTSPLLEGLWKFEWAGARSPAVVTSKFLVKNLPSAFFSSGDLTLRIMDGTAKATYKYKTFGTIESTCVLTTSLAAEGPLRLKEEFVDFVLLPPNIQEGGIPSQFQGLYDQLHSSLQSLPESIKDAVAAGLKLNLGGRFERLLLLSYLDEELLVARDITGAPDVLSRIETKSPVSVDPVLTEYQS